MNKKTLWTLLLPIFLMVGFTSCEDDEDIAYDLSGSFNKSWYGVFGAYDDWTGEPLYSEIIFMRGHSDTEGIGQEVLWKQHYNHEHPVDRYTFDWWIDRGAIYIQYDGGGRPERIYNYYVGRDIFHGYLDSTGEYFELFAEDPWW